MFWRTSLNVQGGTIGGSGGGVRKSYDREGRKPERKSQRGSHDVGVAREGPGSVT